MARMIPSQIEDEGVSKAEKQIFEKLKSDSSTKNWIVLHSLGLARRAEGPYGEIDFVVIIPTEGIVCLEVKGGGVSCQAGTWQTTNQHGSTFVLKKSPYLQARSGMFALKKSLVQHFGTGAAESRCPIGCAVAFPNVTCPPLTPEFDRADVIDFDDLRNPISKSIMRVVRRRLREFQPRGSEHLPAPSEAKTIVNFLRPDFERVVSKGASIGHTEARLLRLTEEQYARLDELEANPRCLFVGAAGTGKTLLALEHARRAERSGSKVLLVCFNRLLGDWLRQQTKGTNITAGNWHAVARQFILASNLASDFEKQESESLKSGNDDSLFDEWYPLFVEGALEEMGAQFDALVVDEAQDLVPQHALGFLDLVIRDGLAEGNWAILGDFTSQALYGDTVDPFEILSQYTENIARAKLTLNCRNTRRIAEETTILAGFEKPPFRLGEEAGLPVEHRYWRTPSDLVESLTHVLENLAKEQMSIDNVMLLSPRRLENSSLVGIDRISHFPLVDSSRDIVNTHPGAIKFSTIQAFKGFESQVIIIVDVDAVDDIKQKSLLYVAMSRARNLLILMIKESARKAVELRVRKAIERKLWHE